MRRYEIKVSFYTNVIAENIEQADEQINQLLNQLGEVNTQLSWEDCEWQAVHASAEEVTA